MLTPSSEGVAEDIERIMESPTLLLLEPFLPILIIRLALLLIRQDLERMSDVEELLSSSRIGILIRMQLFR